MLPKITALFLAVTATFASANDEALDALVGTTGEWEGSLYYLDYLDYQSGDRFSIPMRAMIEATPEGKTILRRLTWTDPGNLVHAVQLVTFDRDTGEYVEAYFREGTAEYLRYEVVEVDVVSDSSWLIIYEHDGLDDDRPSRIRHTLERNDDLLTSKKSVRFLDSDDAAYFERNGSELKMVEATHKSANKP